MKLTTAIELLTRLRDLRYIELGKEFKDSLSLGIEAIKEIQYLRSHQEFCYLEQLPDETKEN